MTIMEALCTYFQGYPPLARERIGIDCLADREYSYSIDAVPTESVTKRYIDGGSDRRFLFTFSSRMYYGDDLKQQADNHAFFEGLEQWLAEQELFFQVPTLGQNRRARPLRVLLSAYPLIVDADSGTARYQIQCELNYIQEVHL